MEFKTALMHCLQLSKTKRMRNQSIERLATGISDAVEAFVKSGT
jgi:hypothetical protein